MEMDESLSTRYNIILIADETHRSQYDLTEKIKSDGRVISGATRKARNSLPNAVYISFTGTPIEEKDHNTHEVFCNYIDVYDMIQ